MKLLLTLIVFLSSIAGPASAQTTTSISMFWTPGAVTETKDPNTGVVLQTNKPTGFKVERRIPSTEFKEIATTKFETPSYVDSVTDNGGFTYCYRVRAYNEAGNSGYSNEACSTTPLPPVPTAPFQAKAKVLSPTQVELRWTDRSNNETGFMVQVVGIGPIREYVATGPNAEVTIVTGLQPGAYYALRVAAVNTGGRSLWTRGVYVWMPRS